MILNFHYHINCSNLYKLSINIDLQFLNLCPSIKLFSYFLSLGNYTTQNLKQVSEHIHMLTFYGNEIIIHFIILLLLHSQYQYSALPYITLFELSQHFLLYIYYSLFILFVHAQNLSITKLEKNQLIALLRVFHNFLLHSSF